MEENKNALDAYLFHQGNATRAYEYLGCHASQVEGEGYRYTFRTWAPNADAVFLVSDFLDWEVGIPLFRVTGAGVYEVTVDSRESYAGKRYKFRIVKNGVSRLKGDPYAFYSEGGASGASIVTHQTEFAFTDGDWLTARRHLVSGEKGAYLAAPVNIYEVHFGSFMRHKEDDSVLSYREMADTLIPYVKSMGYTHIEFLPLSEFPFDGSWGYQVGAFYAPTSRFGAPDDFRYFVNACHTAGVGVILDWVPAHFPKDAWGLYEFDGQPLYEYQGWDRMESRGWGTRFFDLGREEVQSFLISNALYWFREFHIDGLRVDAVAAMLYLDFDKMPGEWVPNRYGENKNLEAIAFLKKLNSSIYAEFGDVLMIAEESTAFPGVTHPISEGGLGFNLKWNMGWANDSYAYLATDPVYRRYHHNALNFPIVYAFSENYVLPVSHDEVVHGKCSLINKMYGTYDEKFRQFRAFMIYMMTFPGKKMLFMGTEYGPFREWDYSASLEWFMLDYPNHRELREFVASLNRFYLERHELWEQDFSGNGFTWIYADDSDHNVVAYKRHALNGDTLLSVVSFAGAAAPGYRIHLSEAGEYRVVFASAFEFLGNENLVSKEDENGSHYIELDLPEMCGIILEKVKAKKPKRKTPAKKPKTEAKSKNRSK